MAADAGGGTNQQRDWVMLRAMLRGALYSALLIGLTAALGACGGGGSGSTLTPTPMSGTMPLTISDASSDDWATIGVKLLSIAFVPQGGGSAVTVWTAPTPAPYVNLEQLDQLGEILGNVSVPVGTYTGAVLTIGANPGDLLLTVAADPESGFPLAPGTSIPAGDTLWAVNFNAPVRHHPLRDLTRLVLRHTYGTVTQVASDGKSLTITKDFPVLPVTNPETAVASSLSLQLFADATNGTILYDLDAKTQTVVKDFTAEAMSLPGKFVRVAPRYQVDGTLVAVRVWASSQFSNVWLSPEGHVLHVDATTDVIT